MFVVILSLVFVFRFTDGKIIILSQSSHSQIIMNFTAFNLGYWAVCAALQLMQAIDSIFIHFVVLSEVIISKVTQELCCCI